MIKIYDKNSLTDIELIVLCPEDSTIFSFQERLMK